MCIQLICLIQYICFHSETHFLSVKSCECYHFLIPLELKDYISDPLTLTFPGGSSTNTQTKVVTIEITDDDIFEDTESFGLLLNSSIPAVRVEPFNFTRVDIVDDDGEWLFYCTNSITLIVSFSTLNNIALLMTRIHFTTALVVVCMYVCIYPYSYI